MRKIDDTLRLSTVESGGSEVHHARLERNAPDFPTPIVAEGLRTTAAPVCWFWCFFCDNSSSVGFKVVCFGHEALVWELRLCGMGRIGQQGVAAD